jgi:hypothetical protein
LLIAKRRSLALFQELSLVRGSFNECEQPDLIRPLAVLHASTRHNLEHIPQAHPTLTSTTIMSRMEECSEIRTPAALTLAWRPSIDTIRKSLENHGLVHMSG